MIDRKTRRKFGQNYLKDPAVLFEMGEAISPAAGDHFFEIGPGMGALTKTINNDGVNIYAMDVDPTNSNSAVIQNQLSVVSSTYLHHKSAMLFYMHYYCA